MWPLQMYLFWFLLYLQVGYAAVMFTKPIKRIGISIEEIAKGNMEEEKDYREVMDISNEFRQLVNKLNTQENKTGICI